MKIATALILSLTSIFVYASEKEIEAAGLRAQTLASQIEPLLVGKSASLEFSSAVAGLDEAIGKLESKDPGDRTNYSLTKLKENFAIFLFYLAQENPTDAVGENVMNAVVQSIRGRIPEVVPRLVEELNDSAMYAGMRYDVGRYGSYSFQTTPSSIGVNAAKATFGAAAFVSSLPISVFGLIATMLSPDLANLSATGITPSMLDILVGGPFRLANYTASNVRQMFGKKPLHLVLKEIDPKNNAVQSFCDRLLATEVAG